jgi:tryptophan synthase alpha chain
LSRLAAAFALLRQRGERALVPYFTAGHPSLGETRELILAAARAGADIVELGVPFSDPLADGPVVQRASHRALAAGITLPQVLGLVRELRREVTIPLVLMTYYNPVLAMGLGAFARGAAAAGVDGVIVVDLPPEEAGPLRAETRGAALDLIHLVAPTSTPSRMRLIARASSGFLYMVSVTGVTGARAALPSDLVGNLRTLRAITTKPICVGFGIGTPEQARTAGRFADGVIVGSAVVSLVERHAGSDRLLSEIGNFIAALKAGVRGAAA